MKNNERLQLAFAAFFGATSIALAAAGNHALHDQLNSLGMWSAFQKGVDYSMYHALSLLAVVLLQRIFPNCHFDKVGYVFIIGVLLFSGGLFLHSLLGLHQFVFIVPVGGSLLIAGWLLLGILSLLPHSKKS